MGSIQTAMAATTTVPASESSLVIGDSIRFRRGEEIWERAHVRMVHDAELNVSVDKEHNVDGKLSVAEHARRCVDVLGLIISFCFLPHIAVPTYERARRVHLRHDFRHGVL